MNDELGALDRVPADGWTLLRPGGRLAVLAYHSLEDRRVKDGVPSLGGLVPLSARAAALRLRLERARCAS